MYPRHALAVILLAALSLSLSTTPAAAPAEPPPAAAEVPPPPDVDDPGQRSVEESEVGLSEAVPEAGEKVLPHEPKPDEPIVPAAHRPATLPEKVNTPDEIVPAVTIRRDGEVTVEEYRREDGLIYMVRFVHDSGVSYTYMDNDGDGRLEGDPKDGPIQPVYYTLYEWN
jgi:hypothetical protein